MNRMRFLHLADLHLGKQMNDLTLLEDQEWILRAILKIAKDERADSVMIAGDVYQRSSPQAEAMALFDRFVSALAGQGMRVFVISGNHDSAARISYFAPLLKASGVYVTEAFEGRLQNVTVRDEMGEIVIWMMPFLRPSQVRRYLPDAKIETCQDAVEAVLQSAPVDVKKRNVLICHQFITGSETSDSEELAVGGLDNIDAAVFDAFDYVALGHIHKPQKVRRDTLRYAGSPLKYSFSEANHKKSVTLVVMGAKGEVRVRTVPLTPLHDVRCLEGMMDELMRMDYSEDYLWITVKDELVPPDARVTLSTRFPNMMKFSIANSHTNTDLDVDPRGRMEEKTLPELFSDFYSLKNSGREMSETHRKVIEKLFREMEETP